MRNFIAFLTDQERDKSTNLYNYDARLYDPVVGRFISADSIIPDLYNPQSLNRYSHTLNNPLKYTDPSGHFEIYVHTDGTGHVGIQTKYNGASRNYDYGRYRSSYKGWWRWSGPAIRVRTNGEPTSSSKSGYKKYNFDVSNELDNEISQKFRDKFDSGSKTIPEDIREKMTNKRPLTETERYAGEDWGMTGPNCVTDTFDTVDEALDEVINDSQFSENMRNEAQKVKDEFDDARAATPSRVKKNLEERERELMEHGYGRQ